MSKDELVAQMRSAIEGGEIEIVERILTEHPELRSYSGGMGGWLHLATTCQNPELVKLLGKFGCDVNETYEFIDELVSPLSIAISNDNPELVSILLELGAKPYDERFVRTAVLSSKKNSLEMLKALEEFGADMHRLIVHPTTGVTVNALSVAMENGKSDVVEYLESRGCLTPNQYAPSKRSTALVDEQDADIVAFFAETFGPVEKNALIEMVPSDPPIAVHVILPNEKSPCVTLFTTGMSALRMNVPSQEDDDFAFGELFIQMPAEWKWKEIEDPNYGWPIHWLRSIGKYPMQNDTWLGGPVAIVGGENASETLAPNVGFNSMLLLAEHQMTAEDERLIRIYRMMPLYQEERQLEMEKGIGVLMQSFDAKDVSFVVDIERENVAK